MHIILVLRPLSMLSRILVLPLEDCELATGNSYDADEASSRVRQVLTITP